MFTLHTIGKKTKKWLLGAAFIFILGGGGYYYFFGTAATVTNAYAVVGTVATGTVSSGIQTSGTIVAAQKLDLDVYKQASRIEAVNVTNSGHVEAGTVLFSFDKSGANVNVQSSRVEIAEAELALSNAQANATDPNTTLRTLQNKLVALQSDVVQAEKDLETAKHSFYNQNLTVESGNKATEDKTRPTLSGYYNGDTPGVYTITVYKSSAASGYSYRVTGLETQTESVLSNTATNLGAQGLKISFPDTLRGDDVWTVAVPNTTSPEYMKNKEAYEKTVRTLNDTIASTKVDIENAKIDIKNESQTDTSSYRDLTVDKAAAALAKARQGYVENYDVVKEQDIVAPFAGTVAGMENVVVGATPTGNTNDTITLGTLISDEFLVEFSLGATDITKVAVGQKVLVHVTSYPSLAPLTAQVTQVSSLPESDGVAQYKVQALIANDASSTVVLREGLLAEIEVVEDEVTDVLRVPVSALSYENGNASVQVVGDMTEEQKTELDKNGVITATNGVFPSHAVAVTVGVVGTYYAEIKTGIAAGTQIIVSKTESDSSVVQQDRMGPPDDNKASGGSSGAGGNQPS